MTTEATPTAIDHATQMGALPSGIVPTYGYYRQPDGWITVSPATELEELKYLREGWTALRQYGVFEMATQWAADHPFEAILQNGGIEEFSLDQILRSAMHIEPPVIPTCNRLLSQGHKRHVTNCWRGAKPVEWPQLKGLRRKMTWPCNFCSDVKPTEEAIDQHMTVMHKEEQSELRTGQILGDQIVRGLKGLIGKGAAGAPEDAAVAIGETLAKVGLTDKQIEALREQGIDIPDAD